jgi:tetratricopeptide (TPR) repeat protein
MNLRDIAIVTALSVGAAAAPLQGQGFGWAKSRVTLERKLPALIQLPGDSIRVKVVGHQDQSDLARDLQALLETELMKDKPDLRVDEDHAGVTVFCQIINFARPQRTITREPGVGNAPPQIYTRITGALSVSFQAKTSGGRALESDNIDASYDQQFDSSGNNASHGVMGGLTSGWHKIKGSSSTSQDDAPPTDDELRQRILMMAVHRIAEHIVNTDESIDVFLAKYKGPLEEGDKQAEAGLWERALETFETAAPLTKRDDDAYRLYNIGVANEALGYQAKDTKTAMKFLDQAAIEYGKAIDAKPGEKYFLIPQKRIETALTHYHKLEAQKNAPVVADNAPPAVKAPAEDPPPAPHTVAAAEVHGGSGGGARGGTIHSRSLTEKALTNTQVVAMVKAGVSDDTVTQAVRNAKSVDFDLSLAARRHLTESGVSPAVLDAMKVRWAHDLTSGK